MTGRPLPRVSIRRVMPSSQAGLRGYDQRFDRQLDSPFVDPLGDSSYLGWSRSGSNSPYEPSDYR